VQIGGSIPKRLQQYRALVVIENDLRRSVIVDLLDDIGIRNTSTHCVEGALKKLKEYVAAGEDFNVIVADMVLNDGTASQLHKQADALPSANKTAMIQLVPESGRPPGIGFVEFQVGHPITSANLKIALLNALEINDYYQTTAARPSSVDTGSGVRLERATHLRILLAEDNLINQKLAIALLEKEGHEVTVGDSKDPGFRACQRNPRTYHCFDGSCRCR